MLPAGYRQQIEPGSGILPALSSHLADVYMSQQFLGHTPNKRAAGHVTGPTNQHRRHTPGLKALLVHRAPSIRNGQIQ
jgi:hypothetical protein